MGRLHRRPTPMTQPPCLSPSTPPTSRRGSLPPTPDWGPPCPQVWLPPLSRGWGPPGLALLSMAVVLLLAAAVLILGLLCRGRPLLFLGLVPQTPPRAKEPSAGVSSTGREGVHRAPGVVGAGRLRRASPPAGLPFSPRFFRERSMWSLSWMRTWRSVGWSRMKGNLSSCSVGGRLRYVLIRHVSMKSVNFLDLEGKGAHAGRGPSGSGGQSQARERSSIQKPSQFPSGLLHIPSLVWPPALCGADPHRA